METIPDNQICAPNNSYLNTAKRLLDGIILYRIELGDVGRQLELLLRVRGVAATTDLPCSDSVH